MKERVVVNVFLSYSRKDRLLANQVIEILQAKNLTWYASTTSLAPGSRWTDVVREAIAESQVVIFVVGETPTRWLAVEFGAALAWDKPIVMVHEGPMRAALKLFTRQHDVVTTPISRLSTVLSQIRAKRLVLSDDEKAALADLYRRQTLTVDELLAKPGALTQLVNRFRRSTKKKDASVEDIATALIRMRKLGKLPRIKRKPDA